MGFFRFEGKGFLDLELGEDGEWGVLVIRVLFCGEGRCSVAMLWGLLIVFFMSCFRSGGKK